MTDDPLGPFCADRPVSIAGAADGPLSGLRLAVKDVWAVGRIPGGWSSGSASAVAGGLADFALGTDCAGSVRVPASLCGVFGIRPTDGRVSAEGGHRKRFRAVETTATRKPAMLDAAKTLDFMGSRPGNRLEALKGDRAGQWSVRVNDQWRLCFVWTDSVRTRSRSWTITDGVWRWDGPSAECAPCTRAKRCVRRIGRR